MGQPFVVFALSQIQHPNATFFSKEAKNTSFGERNADSTSFFLWLHLPIEFTY